MKLRSRIVVGALLWSIWGAHRSILAGRPWRARVYLHLARLCLRAAQRRSATT